MLCLQAIFSFAQADSLAFPQDWLGHWAGSLHIYDYSGLKQTVPMQLELIPIEKDSVWTWAITYGEDSLAQKRAYELHVVDQSKGHYQIDEKNSIVLDGYRLGNHFTSTFKVQSNYLISDYALEGDELIFTIHFFAEQAVRESGGESIDGSTIPIVYSYPNTILQEATLRRLP